MYFRLGQNCKLKKLQNKKSKQCPLIIIILCIFVKWPPQKHRLTWTCSTPYSAHRQTLKVMCVETRELQTGSKDQKSFLFSPNIHTSIQVYNTVMLVHTLSCFIKVGHLIANIVIFLMYSWQKIKIINTVMASKLNWTTL